MCFRAGIARLEWFGGFLSERLLAREDAQLPVGHCMSDGMWSPEQRCGAKAQSAGQNATELQPKTLQRRTSKIARCRSVSAHANVGDKRGLTTRRGTGRAARHGRRGTGVAGACLARIENDVVRLVSRIIGDVGSQVPRPSIGVFDQ